MKLNTVLPAADRFDVFERAMHNNILAAVGEDGKHFFYQNPLGRARRRGPHAGLVPLCRDGKRLRDRRGHG